MGELDLGVNLELWEMEYEETENAEPYQIQEEGYTWAIFNWELGTVANG